MIAIISVYIFVKNAIFLLIYCSMEEKYFWHNMLFRIEIGLGWELFYICVCTHNLYCMREHLYFSHLKTRHKVSKNIKLSNDLNLVLLNLTLVSVTDFFFGKFLSINLKKVRFMYYIKPFIYKCFLHVIQTM